MGTIAGKRCSMRYPLADNPHGDSGYGFIVPFLDESLPYAFGVELGMLLADMRHLDVIEGYYTLANQEQITLMANRLKWRIDEMKPWDKGDWFWLRMHAIPELS